MLRLHDAIDPQHLQLCMLDRHSHRMGEQTLLQWAHAYAKAVRVVQGLRNGDVSD
jgi:hypothetical protein